ncbi:low molecular weight protein-tyrosine-phosphatase [Salinicola sp. JS01]|uniref:low molecular weight protein-tyrosine-phosphatase n=1 Tax=Salinicola sp. JS01 TaxID=3050071 RepID=UPI00255BDE6D|nr:low molecular weight protein-tyrosine-phosphatase [Salinicola sp. JS01]WIX34476.1 low molecular weight protein-tyrosine-phosphatase [Salinicola sp. JS01]
MAEREPSYRVLFVCLGNICRSPTAEGMLRQRLMRLGLSARIAVDSCGTGAWHVGQPPDLRAQRVARERGIDLSGLRARQLVREDFERFDEILVMDGDNLEQALMLAPAASRARVVRLLSYLGEPESDVPDPYYGGDTGFTFAIERIEAAVACLAESLAQRLSAAPHA